MYTETILAIHLRSALYSASPLYIGAIWTRIRFHTRLHGRLHCGWVDGLMYMLSIVRVLYLSSKSLSLHTHSDEDTGYGRERMCLTAPWIIAY